MLPADKIWAAHMSGQPLRGVLGAASLSGGHPVRKRRSTSLCDARWMERNSPLGGLAGGFDREARWVETKGSGQAVLALVSDPQRARLSRDAAQPLAIQCIGEQLRSDCARQMRAALRPVQARPDQRAAAAAQPRYLDAK